MVLKYNELLFESMLKEAVLYLSPTLSSVLKKIDSPISSTINSYVERDIPNLSNNYIDLVEGSTDEVSFTTVAKIKQQWQKSGGLYKLKGWTQVVSTKYESPEIWKGLKMDDEPNLPEYLGEPEDFDTIIELIRSFRWKGGDWGYFKSVSTNEPYILAININMVKFDGDENTFVKGFYNMARNKIKIGRFVRSLLRTTDAKFSDRDIEEFVNKFKAAISDRNDIEKYMTLVSGEDIKYWYNEEQYLDGGGTLNQSCMRDEDCSDYFDIYITSDNCQLLILKSDIDEEKIVARALVWKTNNGFTFMDRIYTVLDQYVQVFRNYAKKNGWYYKKNDNSDEDCPLIKPDGEEFVGEISVDVSSGGFDAYPYVDTLKFYYVDAGTLSNSLDKSELCIELSDTEGRMDTESYGCPSCGGDNGEECEECNGCGSTDEDCENCGGDGKVDCNDCDGTGKIDCGTCDGTGKDEDDQDCSDCDGTGKADCDECEGTGKESCYDCNGDGTTSRECDNCDGSGHTSCGGKVHGILNND